MNRIYTDEMIEYIKQLNEVCANKEAVALFNNKFNMNMNVNRYRDLKERNGIKSKIKNVRKSKLWPDEVQEFIKQNVKGRTNQEIADMILDKFGITYTKTQINDFKKDHHLRSNWRAPKGYTNNGSFRKGEKPFNTKQVGELYFNTEGKLYIKISNLEKETRFNCFALHRLMYELYHDEKLTDNDVVIFLNGNKCDFSEENLMKISKDEQGIISCNLRYGYSLRDDAEFNKALILTQRLKRVAKEVANEKLKNNDHMCSDSNTNSDNYRNG